MTPRQFLYIAGVILLALGVFGFIVPNPAGDTTGKYYQYFHLDNYENTIHVILGVVAIGAAYFFGKTGRWWIALLYGVAGLGFGILGFALSGRGFPNLGGADLDLFENLLHLVVGLWAAGVCAYTYRHMRSRPEMIREAEKKPEERKIRKAA